MQVQICRFKLVDYAGNGPAYSAGANLQIMQVMNLHKLQVQTASSNQQIMQEMNLHILQVQTYRNYASNEPA